MHRLISRSLPVMLMSAALWMPAPPLAGAAADEQSYVVTIKPNAAMDGVQTVAGQLAASYGGVVTDPGATKGEAFVIRLSAVQVPLVAGDPRVRSVAPMHQGRAVPDAVETVSWTGGVSYAYDASGNVRQIGNDAFAYDTSGRLVQATVNSVRRTYDYDAFGNRTACTQLSPNDCQLVTINAAENMNRIKEASYDGSGNVTALEQHRYSYDALNMMTRDDSAALAREFVYTADDERIATYTVGSSWRWTARDTSGNVLREFSSQDGPAGPASGAWKWEKDYIWRNGLLLASRQPERESTTTYHYHLDNLGTPRRVTDQNDRIVGVHDYFTFGPETSGGAAEPSLTTLKYTGHERDSVLGGEGFDTLDYMHARYYSPSLGRFLSIDRAPGDKTRPQSWNRFAYASSNPLKYVDRTGLFIELAASADRQYFVNALASGTSNKAARELLVRLAADPLHKVILATGNLTDPSRPASAFLFGDSGHLIPPFTTISGNLFPTGVVSTVDKGKLAMTTYPTPTITVYHELKHDDVILYSGMAANARYPDQIAFNTTTGQVTVNSIFEDFGRAAATVFDDPMHALTLDQVNGLVAEPGQGQAKTQSSPCPFTFVCKP
jgi:RHS repeat-associated protein